MRSYFFFILLVLLVFHGSVESSRIVLFQFGGPVPNSHFMLQDRVSVELASRGHTVMVVAGNDTVSHVTRTQGIVLETYPSTSLMLDVSRNLMKWAMFVDNHIHPQLLLALGMMGMHGNCDTVVTNTTLLQRIKDFNADVMFHDVMLVCPNVLAAKLGIPLVSIHSSAIMETWFNSWNRGSPFRWNLPNPIAYNPQLRSRLWPPMNMIGRIYNSALYFLGQLIHCLIFDPPVLALLRRHGVDLRAPGAPGRATMLLVNADFAIEVPRPLPAHVQMVGPIMVQPPNLLPEDLEAFLSNSENGIVFVSAGTLMSLELPQLMEIGRALSRLPVNVLWKLSKEDVPDQATMDALSVAENVKVVTTWLPQSDLLAHNKTRAFLSHCGVNSVYEAMWHGVPVVGLPGGADQPDNALKLAHRGAGIALPFMWNVKEDQVYHALMRVLTEPSFKEKAQEVSLRLRSHKRTGLQRAADWIEHVADTDGAAYLRPPVDELSFIAQHSLDVIVFWGACLALPPYTLRRCILRRRKRRRGADPDQSPKRD